MLNSVNSFPQNTLVFEDIHLIYNVIIINSIVI